ncbi:MAG: sulfite exporter TauE/SafE family protein [Pedobacter sp.]
MTDPSWPHMLLLALVGVMAGVLNVLAGGGSLLTLPLLIFMGLPAATANGTNRIAILVQNLFAITGFHRLGVLSWRLALLCAAPAVLGSYFGARLAVQIDDALFQKLLAGIMLGVLALTLWDPAKRLQGRALQLSAGKIVVLLASFFSIGVYGGFVQAGVGFLIIAGLLFQGLDLVQTNAIKVTVVFFFTLIALGVFIRHGQVNYQLGLSLAAGNAAGGWLAAHLAVKKGHAWMKRVVSLAVAVFAVKLLLG